MRKGGSLARSLRWSCPGVIAVLFLLNGASAWACSTPVYRYAMYNWAPSPQFVFYLHRGGVNEKDQKVNQLIDELAETGPAAANVLLTSVDVTDQKQLDRLPGPVKDAWQSHEEIGLPMHLVFSPRGVEMYAGRLDEAAVRAMVDSPARTRFAELLHEGHATVFLFVPGSDAAENARAEKEAKELIARVDAGKVPIESDLGIPGAEGLYAETPDTQPADDEQAPQPSRFKVALLKVERSDPAEEWLIRSLMVIEPDLAELADEPMLFAGYGRGRALEPYVGKGITADNLEDVVMFLGSACSCMVKEQNPGVDLVVRWDWEATADRMAADDPSLYGGPFGYQEFAMDDVAEAEASTDTETTAEVDSAGTETPSESEASETPSTEPGPTGETPQPAVAEETASSDTPAVETEADDALANAPIVPPDSSSFTATQVWTYAVGLVAAALLVLGAGFVLIRKQSTKV